MLRVYVCLAAFIGVLCLPFAVRFWLGNAGAGDPVERSTDGALTLRIITPHNQDIRRVFEPAFSDWHRKRFGQAVDITYMSPGGTNEIVRYLTDVYGSYRDSSGRLLPEHQVDSGIEIVWGGGDYVFDRVFKPLLKPLTLSRELLDAAFPRTDLAGVPLLDIEPGAASPKWVGIVLSSFGIIHAPEFYEVLGLPAPESWHDLARPELSGLLALADPTKSGSAAFIYMMVLQRAMASAEQVWLLDNPGLASTAAVDLEQLPAYRQALGAGWKSGMRTLLLMAANARYFTDSGSRPCADVGDAESAAGVAIDFYARVFQEQIGKERITYLAPRGATAVTPDPIGVLYGTRGEREVLANRFVEFLLSPEAQRLWNVQGGASPYVARSLRRMPVRRDVYADRSGWADDDNPFEAAAGFNMRQAWMRQLGRLIPIWAASWIDTKPSLDRAYNAILRVADRERRETLLFELSDLPVHLEDVTTNGAPAPEAHERVDPRLRAARERMRWAARFRGHYAELLARAEDSG